MKQSILFIFVLILASCGTPHDPRAPFDSTDGDDTLVGTAWRGDGGWLEGVTLVFETEVLVVYNDNEHCDYTYKDATKTGNIAAYGTFTVNGDYTRITFTQWKQYPHGAEFIRE